MAYGQKNYNEKQGINGKYTIREIGCYLTAFCNLLERFGMGVDPITLNRVFKERGIYIDVDDGIRDDLGWQSVTAYNGHIVASSINNSGAVPPNRNSIVRIKAKNQFGTHFCLVDRIENGVVWVVDSWDGQVRKASYYGPISGWATYVNNTPQPVKPAPTPAYDGDTIVVQPGWGISHAAKAAGYPDFASEARWNAIAQLNGHGSYGSFKLSPGQRIKVGKYSAPAPAPQPAPQPKPAPEPPKADPNIALVTIQPGWGVSHAMKSIGYPKELYSDAGEWAKVAEVNGQKLENFKLVPGQVIKVRKYTPPATPPTPAPVAAPVSPQPEVKPAEPAKPKDFRETLDKTVSGKYKAVKPTIVKDYNDQPQPDLNMPAIVSVDVQGVFEKDGNKYYLTKKSAENGWWYGIPVDALDVVELDKTILDEDDEIFQVDMDDIDNSPTHKKLSNREHLVALVAKVRGVILGIVARFKKNKEGEK